MSQLNQYIQGVLDFKQFQAVVINIKNKRTKRSSFSVIFL